MAPAVAADEVLQHLAKPPPERQRVAVEFIKFLVAAGDDADERIDVNEEVKHALEEIRAGRVDRRDWQTVLRETSRGPAVPIT